MITAPRAKNLDLIRKIRNDFAHKRESNLKFESPSINDRVDALTIPSIPKNIPVNFSWKDRRGKFRRIVSAEAAFLHGHGKLAKLAAEKPTTDKNWNANPNVHDPVSIPSRSLDFAREIELALAATNLYLTST